MAGGAVLHEFHYSSETLVRLLSEPWRLALEILCRTGTRSFKCTTFIGSHRSTSFPLAVTLKLIQLDEVRPVARFKKDTAYASSGELSDWLLVGH